MTYVAEARDISNDASPDNFVLVVDRKRGARDAIANRRQNLSLTFEIEKSSRGNRGICCTPSPADDTSIVRYTKCFTHRLQYHAEVLIDSILPNERIRNVWVPVDASGPDHRS